MVVYLIMVSSARVAEITAENSVFEAIKVKCGSNYNAAQYDRWVRIRPVRKVVYVPLNTYDRRSVLLAFNEVSSFSFLGHASGLDDFVDEGSDCYASLEGVPEDSLFVELNCDHEGVTKVCDGRGKPLSLN